MSVNVPFIGNCIVLVPQTNEPFYSYLAGAALEFDYIEEGIGYQDFMEWHFDCNWRYARHVARSWRRHRKLWYRRIQAIGYALSWGQSDLARKMLLRNCSAPPVLYIDLVAARRIYCLKPYPHRKVRYVALHERLSLGVAKGSANLVYSDALLLLPGNGDILTLIEVINARLSELGISRLIVKRHPSVPIIGNGIVERLRCDSVCLLGEEEEMEEPVVVMIRRNIGVLLHCGSSGGYYAGLLGTRLGLSFHVVNLS